MTLAERLLRKLYRREIWHEPDGTMDVACDANDPGAEVYYANPDGPEAAARIKVLEEALLEFCERVERGEVRSRRTYRKFNQLLGRGKLIENVDEHIVALSQTPPGDNK
jgi:hypothetical protein